MTTAQQETNTDLSQTCSSGHELHVKLTAPIPLGDLVADAQMEGGAHRSIILRNGRFQGALPARPLHLRLTAQQAPKGESPLRIPDSAEEPSAPLSGEVYGIEELFETGVPVTDGQVALQLVWGLHCHRSVEAIRSPKQDITDEGGLGRCTRFGSFEHILCAQEIGLDATGQVLRFNGRQASFHSETLLLVGSKQLTFGQILALAGDYYAHLDDTAALALPDAWPAVPLAIRLVTGDYRLPTLVADEPKVVGDILHVAYRDKEGSQTALSEAAKLAKDGLFGHYPVRRYLALASQNFCHFACQPPTGELDDGANEALQMYRAYHERALKHAEQAQGREEGLMEALVIDAFGCHFLTDLFATGHQRVPRRLLSERYGVVRGALGMAHEMHCEDNKLGLWCTTRAKQSPRQVWRGYGDTMLFKEEAHLHRMQVSEAVRRSAAEVFARFCGATLPEGERAEAILPVPLAAGVGPESEDVFPGRGVKGRPQGPANHYPLYCWLPQEKILARRTGVPHENRYVDHDHDSGPSFALSFGTHGPHRNG